MTILKILLWLLIALAVLAAALAITNYLGARHWQTKTVALQAELEKSARPIVPAVFDAQELDTLPAPVQRFFRAALTAGQPMVRALTITHSGSFNMGESADQWKPFTSTQRVVTQRPGFVWDGSVMMMPGLPVRVHDAYVNGRGILEPAVLGVVSLVKLEGSGDIATGEFMRFVAEAAWYPTALLPSQGVRWDAIDAQSAKATIRDGSVLVAMTFRFNADSGLIDGMRVEARGRTVGGNVIMTPWEGAGRATKNTRE
jgi:hypothetical protein